MKIQDKQFTVKYDVRSLMHGVSIPYLYAKNFTHPEFWSD